MKILKLVKGEFIKKKYLLYIIIIASIIISLGFAITPRFVKEQIFKTPSKKYSYKEKKYDVEKLLGKDSKNEKEVRYLEKIENTINKYIAEEIKESKPKRISDVEELKKVYFSYKIIEGKINENIDLEVFRKIVMNNMDFNIIDEEIYSLAEIKDKETLDNLEKQLNLIYKKAKTNNAYEYYKITEELWYLKADLEKIKIKFYEELLKKENSKEYRDDDKISKITLELKDLEKKLLKAETKEENEKLLKQIEKLNEEKLEEDKKIGPNEETKSKIEEKIKLLKSNEIRYRIINVEANKERIKYNIPINEQVKKEKLLAYKTINTVILNGYKNKEYDTTLNNDLEIKRYERIIEKAQYAIDNDLEYSNLNTENFYYCEIVIVILGILLSIGLLLVTCKILTQEFSSGTIKLILTRPCDRWKVIISKYIALLIIAVILMTIVFGGIIAVFKFKGYDINLKVIKTNLENNTLYITTLLKVLLIKYLFVCLNVILVITIIFSISTIFTSSIFTILAGILTIIINTYLLKLPLKIKVLGTTLNIAWINKIHLSKIYTVGEFSELMSMIMGNYTINYLRDIAVIILIIIFILLLAIYMFNKKEIKNKN